MFCVCGGIRRIPTKTNWPTVWIARFK